MRIFIYFVLGLLLTPLVTFFLGWLLFGQRSTWNVSQGESFMVFIVAVYATPFGGIYWALMALVQKLLANRVPAGWIFGIAFVIYVTVLNIVLWTVERS